MENVINATTAAPSTTQASAVKYASFGARFLAALIDGILISVVASVLGSIFGVTNYSSTTTDGSVSFNYSNPFTLLGYVYSVFMIYKYGATVGKMALGLKVQNEETGQNLTIVQAIIRETVGKILSTLVLLIGYFWMLWDPKKQTWHDKLAKSIVVKIK